MGIYTPRAVPPILTASWINDELGRIATAHNSHAKENFPDRCVPPDALQSRYAYWVEILQGQATITSNDSIYHIVPTKCVLTRYTVCTPVTDASAYFLLRYYTVDSAGLLSASATSILGSTALSAANTVVSGSLNVTLYPGYLIEAYLATGAGAIDRATVALTYKSNHTS